MLHIFNVIALADYLNVQHNVNDHPYANIFYILVRRGNLRKQITPKDGRHRKGKIMMIWSDPHGDVSNQSNIVKNILLVIFS